MNEILQRIQKIGIVPVVVLDDAKDAVPLAKALCEGGLPCAEVTFRTAAAEESIRIISTEFPICWWEPVRCSRPNRWTAQSVPEQNLL